MMIDLDDLRARNAVEDVAGRLVKLRRASGARRARLLGPCPLCGGSARSSRFEVLPSEGRWVCAVCQDGGDVIKLVMLAEAVDFRTAVERLGGGKPISEAARARAEAKAAADSLEREAKAARIREDERRSLYRMWCKAVPITDTPVAPYLKGRALDPSRMARLRAIEALNYVHGEIEDERGRKAPRVVHRGPAMLAAIVGADGRFAGLHQTWIDPDRPGEKAEILDPDTGELLNAKKMRGSIGGGHIDLSVVAAPRVLLLGEGIETAQSFAEAAFDAGRLDPAETGVWSGLSIGNMAGRASASVAHPTRRTANGRVARSPGPEPDMTAPGIAIPSSVERLFLLRDGDSDPFDTDMAMRRAAARYRRDGRVILIASAPDGFDFNDLKRRR
jgi:hypothetical protein